MDFEQALTYELQAITGLSGKVFPQRAVENMSPPFVVYISSEGEPIMTLSGPTDMTELSCEIHVSAETYEEMKSLTKNVTNRLQTFFQRSIGQNGPLIKSISHTEPIEDIDNNTNFHISSFDIRVRF
jgi:uncharacterized protein YggE